MKPQFQYSDPTTGATLHATPEGVVISGTGGAIDGQYALDDPWPDPSGPATDMRSMLAALIEDDDLRFTICGPGERCDFCGRWRECRPFYRYTNPQSGHWCHECYEGWATQVMFFPTSHGSILSAGWDEDEEAL